MSSSKSATSTGRKQTPMPGPKSATYKKIVAATKKAVSKKRLAPKPRKRPRRVLAFSTVEARQRALERIKRTIWLHLDKINDGIIRLAISGNYQAAKTLFDIAGVYSLPPLEEEPKAKAQPLSHALLAPEPPAGNSTPPAVDAFFQSIGIEPLLDEPVPGMAAASL